MKRLADIGWWVVFVLCGFAVLAHTFLLQVNNMPLSPLKLEMANFLSDYVNPYFVQHWNFFAPDPPTEDDWVVARAKSSRSGTTNGAARTTPWLNLTQPLVNAVAHDRFTPLFLVELGLSNATTAFMNRVGNDPDATTIKNGKTYLKSRIPADADRLDLAYMRRTAIASLEIRYPGNEIKQIQIGIEIYRYPRFTNRNMPASPPSVSLVTTPWATARYVTPYCCTHSGDALRGQP